ncbi:hypothetical protein [Porphyromonas sp.]|uniref:hypothetical protein n=1 Tax=Porphyromonas sp. TaxID=1924944 RepID=UPI0026DB6679|nr:hypothetical protein [Porphyromonas sp.]MDO4695443.1 hypothetical protein [Porphyromonas sp.]MDO4771242.1 hypothetical protein [Porphyromonas sp.]
MNARFLFPLLLITLFWGCGEKEVPTNDKPNEQHINQVLMLKVDYLTNAFSGGVIFDFAEKNKNFTIETEYIPPGDVGTIKLYYKEINKLLFHGSIFWMGAGKIVFPEQWVPAEKFETPYFKRVAYPKNGFLNVFDPENENPDYSKAWLSIQGLTKVREFLKDNPEETVKLFLYTPSVGTGELNEWCWIFLLKR